MADDLTDKIMKYENNEMGREELIEFFQHLIDTGLAYKLQGHYGRAAENLISRGYCHRPVNNQGV